MRWSFVVVPVLLAACQPAAPPPAADLCGASRAQGLVGQHRDVLAAMTFPAPMRSYGPDDAITMDVVAERLNVIHDRDGIIQRVTCG